MKPYNREELIKARQKYERWQMLTEKREAAERYRKELSNREPLLAERLSIEAGERDELAERMKRHPIRAIFTRDDLSREIMEADEAERAYMAAGDEYDRVAAALAEIDEELNGLSNAKSQYSELYHRARNIAMKADSELGKRLRKLEAEKQQAKQSGVLLDKAIEQCSSALRNVTHTVELLQRMRNGGQSYVLLMTENTQLDACITLVSRHLNRLYDNRKLMPPMLAELVPTESLTALFEQMTDGLSLMNEEMENRYQPLGKAKIEIGMQKVLIGADALGNQLLIAIGDLRSVPRDHKKREEEMEAEIERLLLSEE